LLSYATIGFGEKDRQEELDKDPPEKYPALHQVSVIFITGGITSLRHLHSINNVNQSVSALYVRVYHFSVTYLKASVKEMMNLYVELLALYRRY
jgi:hypothetical protein